MKFQAGVPEITKTVILGIKAVEGIVNAASRGEYFKILEAITNSTKNVTDASELPAISELLFETAEIRISSVQAIELIVQDFEKVLFQLKMTIYKLNNEARAKMDGIASYPYWMYYAQNLFASPVTVSTP